MLSRGEKLASGQIYGFRNFYNPVVKSKGAGLKTPNKVLQYVAMHKYYNENFSVITACKSYIRSNFPS